MTKASRKDIASIRQLHDTFYDKAQHIIERYYLLPLTKNNYGSKLPAREKPDLKDGHVERELHGGMHVARVQFWVYLFNETIKAHFTAHTTAVFEILQRDLGLTETLAITLTRYAALFHDSARENEGSDWWDKDSAENYKTFLTTDEISPVLADIFSKAAAFKDHPDQYNNFLLENKISDADLFAYDYIRQLIRLSDCVDIIRCTSHFKLSKLEKEFKLIEGYDSKAHAPIIKAFATHVHDVIKAQKDLLWASVLFDDETHCFDLGTKVDFEHANNVCSAIGQSITEHPYFSEQLAREKTRFTDTRLASVTPKFTPHIHGSNSFLLPHLRHTKYLLSTIALLEDHHLAPFGGEIIMGGLDGLTEVPRAICFGRMRLREGYTLERVISGYTRHGIYDNKDSVQDHVTRALERGPHLMNVFLVEYARSKQLGIEALEPGQYDAIVNMLEARIQTYYLLRLVGTKIYPDTTALESVKDTIKALIIDTEAARTEHHKRIIKIREVCPDYSYDFEEFMAKQPDDLKKELVYTHFSLEALIKKMSDVRFDAKSAFKNLTPETLANTIAFLDIPETTDLDADIFGTIQVSPHNRRLFTTSAPAQDEKRRSTYNRSDFNSCLTYGGSPSLGTMMTELFNDNVDLKSLAHFDSVLDEHISILEKKLETFKKIHAQDNNRFQYTDTERYFLDHPFPIILVVDAPDKIALFSFAENEFRSDEPLTFGTEIPMIATDTQKHQVMVKLYLQELGIDNVDVILIEQLKQSEVDGLKPYPEALCSANILTQLSVLNQRERAVTAIDTAAIHEQLRI